MAANINSKDGDEVMRAMKESDHMKPLPTGLVNIATIAHDNLRECVLEFLREGYAQGWDEDGTVSVNYAELERLAATLIHTAGKGGQAPWHIWDIVMDGDAQNLKEEKNV